MLKKFKDISNTENGLLTRLFREFMYDTGRINTIETDVSNYILKGGTKAKASVQNNIIDGEMSWKTFVFLMFEIIKLKKLTLTVTGELDSGISITTSVVSVPKKSKVTKTKAKGKPDGNGDK